LYGGMTAKHAGPADGAAVARRPTIEHVGAAVDSYPEGRDAVALGAALAAAAGAELMLLAVEPDLPLIIPGLDRKRVRQETEATLREITAALAPDARHKIDVDLSTPRGLHRLVRDERRDLLVLGSTRHGNEGEVSIGRLTRQLISDLQCALAIAPRGLAASDGPTFATVGVGCDGGPESLAALGIAAVLAEGAGARLIVRGTVDDRIPTLGWPNVWMNAVEDSWEEMVADEERTLHERIDAALAALGDLEQRSEVQVDRGRPADSLVGLSADVDLLVIGSRRWGPLARLLLGGTGEALVHGARCPLLIVPRSGHDG